MVVGGGGAFTLTTTSLSNSYFPLIPFLFPFPLLFLFFSLCFLFCFIPSSFENVILSVSSSLSLCPSLPILFLSHSTSIPFPFSFLLPLLFSFCFFLIPFGNVTHSLSSSLCSSIPFPFLMLSTSILLSTISTLRFFTLSPPPSPFLSLAHSFPTLRMLKCRKLWMVWPSKRGSKCIT